MAELDEARENSPQSPSDEPAGDPQQDNSSVGNSPEEISATENAVTGSLTDEALEEAESPQASSVAIADERSEGGIDSTDHEDSFSSTDQSDSAGEDVPLSETASLAAEEPLDSPDLEAGLTEESGATHGFDEDALILTQYVCSECGESVLSLPEFPLLGCLFCCSSFEAVKPTPALLWAPDLIAPFQVDKGLFFETLLRWMPEGELTPDDIFRQVYLDLAEKLYLPFYLFKGSYQADYTAAIGTEEVDELTKAVSIKWERAEGQLDGDFWVLQYGGKGILPPEVIEFLELMPLEGPMVQLFEGFTIEDHVFRPFDVDAETAYEEKTLLGLRATIEQEAKEELGTPHIDDLTIKPTIEHSVRSIYLPVWLLTYEYKEQKYYAVADGILPKKAQAPRIYGTKPSDAYREMIFDSLYFPFKVAVGVATVVMVVLLLMGNLTGWWQFIVVLGYVAFVMGMYRRTERKRQQMVAESREKKNVLLRHLHQKAIDILTSTWRAEWIDAMSSIQYPSETEGETVEEGEEFQEERFAAD